MVCLTIGIPDHYYSVIPLTTKFHGNFHNRIISRNSNETGAQLDVR